MSDLYRALQAAVNPTGWTENPLKRIGFTPALLNKGLDEKKLWKLAQNMARQFAAFFHESQGASLEEQQQFNESVNAIRKFEDFLRALDDLRATENDPEAAVRRAAEARSRSEAELKKLEAERESTLELHRQAQKLRRRYLNSALLSSLRLSGAGVGLVQHPLQATGILCIEFNLETEMPLIAPDQLQRFKASMADSGAVITAPGRRRCSFGSDEAKADYYFANCEPFSPQRKFYEGLKSWWAAERTAQQILATGEFAPVTIGRAARLSVTPVPRHIWASLDQEALAHEYDRGMLSLLGMRALGIIKSFSAALSWVPMQNGLIHPGRYDRMALGSLPTLSVSSPSPGRHDGVPISDDDIIDSLSPLVQSEELLVTVPLRSRIVGTTSVARKNLQQEFIHESATPEAKRLVLRVF